MRPAFLIIPALIMSLAAAAGRNSPVQQPGTQSPPNHPASSQTKNKAGQGPAAKKPAGPDLDAELQRAVEEAGNDRAALVRNLEDYLKRFPEAPRKVQVYRAIVESSMQLRDSRRALDYAERIIALRPEDVSMMLFAVDLLERAGDDASLTRAVGYATRVLDRVEKAGADSKPARASQAEWENEQKKLRMSIYLIRGRLEMAKHDYDPAISDFEKSYRLMPNAAAALHRGEIAELRKDTRNAIEQYTAAFVLPDQSSAPVDRWEARRKLGNLWRLVHGNEEGLGEVVLRAYDTLALPKPAEARAPNHGLTEPYDFILRRPDGSAPLKLNEVKGKILVLNFWATWCLPCRELEPLFEKVGSQYARKPDVVFLAVNGDEDEARVKPYVEREKLRVPVVFSDGLEALLDIRAYPTVIVLDRAGKIIYRAQGFAPEGFVEALSGAIDRALAGSSSQ